jgi:hypothetical protein
MHSVYRNVRVERLVHVLSRVTSHHITSHHITSHHITSHHIMATPSFTQYLESLEAPDPEEIDPTLFGTRKCFLSKTELRTLDGAPTSMDDFDLGANVLPIESENSDRGTEIGFKDWLEYASKRKRTAISYALNGIKYQGHAFASERVDDQPLGIAKVKCWIGDKITTSQKLELNIIFCPRPSSMMRFDFAGPSANAQLRTRVDYFLKDPTDQKSTLHCYFHKIQSSLLATGPVVEWMSTDSLRDYEALIERIMAAALLEIGVMSDPVDGPPSDSDVAR